MLGAGAVGEEYEGGGVWAPKKEVVVEGGRDN